VAALFAKLLHLKVQNLNFMKEGMNKSRTLNKGYREIGKG
jgi:hypothetical protein